MLTFMFTILGPVQGIRKMFSSEHSADQGRPHISHPRGAVHCSGT